MGRVEDGVGAYDAYMAVYIGVGLSPPAFPLPIAVEGIECMERVLLIGFKHEAEPHDFNLI